MTAQRTVAPLAAAIILGLVLTACGQVTANPDPSDMPAPTPVVTPSPKPTATPTPKPVATPTPAPSEEPAVTPTPKPIVTPIPADMPVVMEHRPPMVARSLADRVNVRQLPDLSSPLLRWDEDDPFDVQLSQGQLVFAVVGPLFADGESWYRVMSHDDRYRAFGYGWVAGRFLERESDSEYRSLRSQAHGLGEDMELVLRVNGWTQLTLELAAAPMPGDTSCGIEVTVTDTAGRTARAASFTAENSIVATVASGEVPELWQENAGQVTVDVTTDCSFHIALMEYVG